MSIFFEYANNLPVEQSHEILRSACKMLTNVHEKNEFFILKQSKLNTAENIEKFSCLHVAENIFDVVFKKNRFLLLDNNDMHCDEMKRLSTRYWFLCRPSNIITAGHISVFSNFHDDIQKMVSMMKAISEKNKLVPHFLSFSHVDDILATFFLLEHAASTVRTSSYMSSNHCCEEDCCHMYFTTLAFLERKKDYVFILNEDMTTKFARLVIAENTDINYYFFNGNPKKQELSTLYRKPFVFYCYPHAGTGKMNPVMLEIFRRQGIDVVDILDFLEEDMFRGRLDSKFDIESLLSLLPENKCVMLHYSRCYENLEHVLKKHVPLLMFIRDFRDVVVSNIRYFYGRMIYSGHSSFEDVAMSYMSGSDFRGIPLEKITENIAMTRRYDNVTYLKFEDVNENPMKAYMDICRKTGLTDDPFWVDDVYVPAIRKIAMSNLPPEGRGVPGTWKKYFTPRMKDYFKRHSNGILQAFGYERDDTW